jgi:hypothetical protein
LAAIAKAEENAMSGEDNRDAYAAMAEAVQASVEELLIPFQVASSAPGRVDRSKPPPLPKAIPPKLSTEEFFQKFLVYADRFTDHCCQELSKILRQASVLPEVRGTPTLELAKQIRQGGFEALDKILVSYVEALQRIHVDLQDVAASLSNSSLIGEAMKGAALGQVAGGFGDRGKFLGTVGALAAAGNEAIKQQALLEMQNRLYAEAKGLAFSKIVEYLKAVESLPEHLLDYGCAKCFGGQLDFARQAQAIKQVQSSATTKLRASLEFTLQLQRAEIEATESAAKAAALEKAARDSKSERSWNWGCGGILALVGALFLVGAFVALNSASEDELTTTMGLGAMLLGTGIYILVRTGKKS